MMCGRRFDLGKLDMRDTVCIAHARQTEINNKKKVYVNLLHADVYTHRHTGAYNTVPICFRCSNNRLSFSIHCTIPVEAKGDFTGGDDDVDDGDDDEEDAIQPNLLLVA